MTAEQLRNSILQEAISGRLVPQDPNDEPASNLLLKTASLRKNALQNKYIRKSDAVWVPITDEEKFMELPSGWVWARLGELGMYRKGPFGSSLTKAMFVPPSDTSYKVYEQKNAIQKDYRLGEYYISKAKFDSMQSFVVNSGDIIVSCAGTIGETYVIPEGAPIGIINQALMRVKLYDDKLVDYWLLFFEYIVMTNTELKGNGSAIKNIPPFDILKNLAIPIPPLAEQLRIISKFKELLPIVEQYGKAQKELDELNAALPVRLRTSILQEAMQGKLVPNDESEMPFTIFNSQIEARKQGEIKAKRLKKSDAVVKPITEDEIPFEIPSNWTWYRLSDLANMYTGDSINAEQKLKYYTNVKGMEYIATKDVKFNHEVDYSNGVAIPDERIDKFRIAPAGSILLCVEGGSAGRKIATIERDVCFGNKLCCFATYVDINSFLYYYLQSPMFKDVFRNSITGIIGGVAIKTLRDLLVPLPPLAEQQRIVAKIEELFAEIDKLK